MSAEGMEQDLERDEAERGSLADGENSAAESETDNDNPDRNEVKSLVDHCKRAAIVKHLKTTLKQESETRWHSMIDMLASVLSAYDELVVVLLEREEADLLPDRERIQEMHDLFAAVEPAPEILSASKKPTIHLVIPVYHNLIQHFEHIHPSDHDDIRALQVHALNVFKAELQPDDIHKAAVFLNPSMKHMSFLPESDRVKVVATVMEHVQQIGVPHYERALMPSSDIGAPKPKSIFDFSNLCKFSNENEVEKYIRMRNPPATQDLLAFWQQNEKELPCLSL
ncbi:hypothetical protein RvY_18854 [Ramazzottius varieornatus]|uniref:HAT C-terminal dimerisation domain-containing protein n=1 Tax=Ramazzottius varieornatus TaxID=947166 RepID=A0A1D1W7E2_RAMVA|nr:hypothetical protein RvY_18854 [Ramazzottius varieornatus]